MAVGEDAVESTEKLQRSINKVGDWTKRWRIKLNENKSVHVNFTNRLWNNRQGVGQKQRPALP
ncbi:hypothetical protein ACUWCL_28975, partial [Klebsiella pneumoniae]|uniref:hypothetical protein n=1 Tax=Klebsiella pneumoniae TaxID=573 RepID=UPI00405576D9